MAKDTITVDEDVVNNTIFLSTPYDPEFVTELKQVIPYEDRDPNTGEGRGWNSEDKTWGFDSSHWPAVKRLIQDYFPRATIEASWGEDETE